MRPKSPTLSRINELMPSLDETLNMLDQLNDSIVIINAQARIVFVNKKACQITGYNAKELLQRKMWDFVAPSMAEKVSQNFEKRRQGKKVPETYTLQIVKKDQTIIPAEITVSIIQWMGTNAELVILRDISERKNYKKQLQEAADDWQKSFDAIPDLAIIIDQKHNLLKVNQAFADFAGEPKAQLIGKKCYRLLHKSDKPVKNCPFQCSKNTLRPVTREVLDTKSGIPWLVTTTPVFDKTLNLSFCFHIAKDISAQKRTEEKLRFSEMLHRETIAHLPQSSVVVFDKKKRYLLADGPALKAQGIDGKKMVGKTLSQIFPQTSEAIKLKYRNILEGKSIWHNSHYNGRHYIVHGVPLRDEQSRITGGILLSLDVTEKKSAQQTVRKVEEEFHLLVETLNDFIFKVDAKGRYTYVNPYVEKLTGYKPAEMLNQTPFQFMTKQEAERVGKIFAQAAADRKEIKNLTDTLITKDGREIIFQTNAAPVFDESGALNGYIGVCRDVTRIKKYEEKILESEKKFKTMADQCPMALFLHDPKGRILEVNQATLDRYGYTRRELLRMNAKDIDPDYDARENHGEFWIQLKKDKIKNFEARHRKKDGSFLPVSVFISAVKIKKRQQIIVLAEDITQLKKNQRELINQKIALERKAVALQEVISHVETEKIQTREDVTRNIHDTVIPLLSKLRLKGDSKKIYDLCRKNLLGITESYLPKLKEQTMHDTLSPREIEICNMIKGGLSSKEIARILNVSFETIQKHRNHIRKKLGLIKNTQNLQTYLQNLS
jgi:PAS domain S-box-containing protein